jgi:ribonuclease HII
VKDTVTKDLEKGMQGKTSVAGVDEAGRGSVIGPLVIAGVLIRQEDLPVLTDLGCKDSKLLTPRRREALAVEIKKVCQDYHVIKLSPKEIDAVVLGGRKLHKLNYLEAQVMARVLDALRPGKAYVDASDVLENRFKRDIMECMSFKVDIVSEHKADRNYPVVSAASIIAKVERDGEVAKLAEKYGDVGSGYPSDKKTIDFLELCIELGDYPECIRRSWRPAKKVRGEKGTRQTKLM